MSVAVQSAMSLDFLDALGRLPRPQQKGARSLISKFTSNPTSPGLNYETIHGSKDSQMRSLRIDRSYRAIVHRPAQGNTYMLLWADKHDEAYRWARRHHCGVNLETGAIQVYEPETVVQHGVPAGHQRRYPEVLGPFASLKTRQLTRLGVPKAMAQEVRGWNEAELEEKKRRLPDEAYESLFYYLAGDPYEKLVRVREAPAEPVDPNDLATALLRDDSRSRFVLIHDEVELEEMLNAPLEKWRVFLHPTQRKLVERNRNGPVRVLGAAGTGKTVVAMHRARWLAKREDSKKILFVTFTRNLATDIKNNLWQICGEKEMERIEARTLDSWVKGYLKSRKCDFEILYGTDNHAWQQALSFKPEDLTFPDEFYRVEWKQVVQANGVTSLSEYKRVSRVGRGTGLNRAGRIKVWRVFEEYRRQLAERGLKEVDDSYAAATALIRSEQEDLGYSSVIVDEAQDIGPQAFRLIRSIVPEGKNDLFITGDGHQAIYDRKVVLGRCGINIRGRSLKLKLNYRTTEQTRGWAARLLEGRDIDDLDGGKDDNTGIRSLTVGPEPVVRNYDTAVEQAKAIADYLKGLEKTGERLGNTCVLARTKAERGAIGDLLRDEGLDVVVVERESDDGSKDGVRLATMHRVKGLEFERVVLSSMNRNLVPPPYIIKKAPDEERRVASETMERALVYVAASRAKKELLVLSYGRQSRFLGE